MTIGVTTAGAMIVGLVVSGMRKGGAGTGMGLCQRRRDDAGELGDQKEGDQKPNRARLCPEPLHQYAE
jgi:hypothetical protein